MQRLLIVGAGDLGRELCGWLQLDPAHGRDWQVAGFLDDNASALSDHPCWQLPVVGGISAYTPSPNDRLVIAISEPRTKLKVAAGLLDRGAKFLSWSHASVICSQHVRIGEGVILSPRVAISCEAQIHEFSLIGLGCTIGHDAIVGEGCTLSSQVDITGHVRLDRGVFLGSHAVVMPHGQVGEFARIGAGSVVLRKVAAGTTVMGVPAKKMFDASSFGASPPAPPA